MKRRTTGSPPGRKFGAYTSRVVPGATTTIEIRIDGNGTFHGEYLGAWYEDKTHAGLRAKLDEAVRKNSALTWNYFIDLDEVEFEDTEHSIHTGRYGRPPKIRLEADWSVLKVSSDIGDAKMGRAYRLVKTAIVLDDGTIEDDDDKPDQEEIRYDREGRGRMRVPFTLERWRKLEQIAAAARELGIRLHGVLNQDGDAIAGFLDRSGGEPLALPAMPAASARRKR